MKWCRLLLVGVVLVSVVQAADTAGKRRPNVVLIVCDDLNDYVSGLDGHPQAYTPSMQRLAGSGVSFRRAYSNNPICAPSRSSFLTGVYPHTSRNMFFSQWFRNPVLNHSKTLMEHFRDNGYQVIGSGKVMHHLRTSNWSEFEHPPDYGPFVYDGEKRVAHPSVPEPFRSIGAVDGSFASLADAPYEDATGKRGWIYGTWKQVTPYIYRSESDRDATPDERNATWAAERLTQLAGQKDGDPFFLAVGFIRPHTPLHVPQRFFDRFPLQQVKLPTIRPNDAEDTYLRRVFPTGADEAKGLKLFELLMASYPDQADALRAFTQAYLASVAAVDECIGQVVAAVDRSPLKDNTIVVVTSDHGWVMGAKDFLYKNALWEESLRVPLIVRAPGVTKPGGVVDHPVSLIDLYPTLVDLCGLQGDTRKSSLGAKLEGHSLRPFLQDPRTDTWDGPDAALSMIYAGADSQDDPRRQHWSLRTKRWRYILYNDGSEELYDHDKDPREWHNVAERFPEVTAPFQTRIRDWTRPRRPAIAATQPATSLLNGHPAGWDNPNNASAPYPPDTWHTRNGRAWEREEGNNDSSVALTPDGSLRVGWGYDEVVAYCFSRETWDTKASYTLEGQWEVVNPLELHLGLTVGLAEFDPVTGAVRQRIKQATIGDRSEPQIGQTGRFTLRVTPAELQAAGIGADGAVGVFLHHDDDGKLFHEGKTGRSDVYGIRDLRLQRMAAD